MAVSRVQIILPQSNLTALNTAVNAYIASLVPGDDADPEDPVYECTGVQIVAPAGGLPFAVISVSPKAEEVSPDDQTPSDDDQPPADNQTPAGPTPSDDQTPADPDNGGD